MNSSVCSLPQQERSLPLRPGNSRSRRTAAALLAAITLAAPASLMGFWEVARGEVVLHTTARGTYDSNVFAQTEADDDFYFSLIPELQFLRRAGLGTIDARAGIDFTRFVDFTSEDYENIFASLNISYPVSPQSPLSGGFSTAYTESSGVNDYLNTRIRQEMFSIGLNSVYKVSPRFGLRNSLSYNTTNVEIFSDVESYSGTLGAQWAYSPTLAFFTDYRLRRSRSTGADELTGHKVDNLDHAVFVGATGKLMPRLSGSASFGYQQTDARGGGSDSSLFVTAAELAWALQRVTDITLGIARDMDVSPTDQSVESTSVTLGLTHRVEPKIELNTYVGYREFQFQGAGGRSDETFRAGAGMDYTFTRYWSAGAGYDYTDNDSSSGFADYRRHMTRLFTRYSF